MISVGLNVAGALVQFANGAHGSLEVCRVIQGHKCQMAFEVEGTGEH